MSDFSTDATGDRTRRPTDARPASANAQLNGPHLPAASFSNLAADRRMALEAARESLLSRQFDEGLWRGVSARSISATARFILLQLWIDRSEDLSVMAAVQFLRASTLPNGGWSESISDDCERRGLDRNSAGPASESGAEAKCVANFGRNGFDLNASVMAYLALHLHNETRPATDRTEQQDDKRRLELARVAIVTAGGLSGCDGLSRYWLALFGTIEYDDCPAVPPASLRWPTYFADSLRRQGYWIRSLHVPLSIIWSHRPVKFLSGDQTLNELREAGVTRRLRRLPRGGRIPNHAAGVLGTSLRMLERLNVRPGRRASLAWAEEWITQRTSAEDGLAGTWDGALLGVIALISRGHARQSQTVSDLLLALQNALSGGGLPTSQSPTIDTALGIRALAGMSDNEEASELRTAIEWLLSREVTETGDRSENVKTEPSGWCREYSNQRFAGAPATAMVLIALREQFSENPPSSLVTDDSMVAIIRANSLNLAHRQIAVLDRVAAASRRGRRWLLAMQNADGGWGHTQKAITSGRFRVAADWQSLQDCSTAASTGRVLQALGAWEMACGQTSVDQAVSWLRLTQQEDGYWRGLHDASPLEATCAVIVGLRAVGLPRRDAALQNAAAWCLEMQHEDGGWTCHPTKLERMTAPTEGDAPIAPHSSDSLSTAWALLALVAAGHRETHAVQCGLHWLLSQQRSDGSWPCSTTESNLSQEDSDDAGGTVAQIPALRFRTTISTHAYAMMALNAFEPFPTGRSVRAASSRRRG